MSKVFPLGYEQGFIRPGYVAERIASYVLQSTASAAISTWDIPGYLCCKITLARGINTLLPELPSKQTSRKLFIRTCLLQSSSQIGGSGSGGSDVIVQPNESISPATSRRSILHRSISSELNKENGTINWNNLTIEEEETYSISNLPNDTFVCTLGGGNTTRELNKNISALEWSSLHGYLLFQIFEERSVGEYRSHDNLQKFPERFQNVIVGQSLLRICDIFAASTTPHTSENSDLCHRLSESTRFYEDERTGELLPPAQEFLLRAWLPLSQAQEKKQSAKHTSSLSKWNSNNSKSVLKDTHSFLRPLSRALSPQAAARRAAAIAAATAAAAAAPAVLVEVSLVLPPGLVVGKDFLRLHERNEKTIYEDFKDSLTNHSLQGHEKSGQNTDFTYEAQILSRPLSRVSSSPHLNRSSSPSTKSLSSRQGPPSLSVRQVISSNQTRAAASVLSSASSSHFLNPSPLSSSKLPNLQTPTPTIIKPIPHTRLTGRRLIPSSSTISRPTVVKSEEKEDIEGSPKELLKYIDDLKGLVKGMEKQLFQLKVDVNRSSNTQSGSRIHSPNKTLHNKKSSSSSSSSSSHKLESVVSRAAVEILSREADMNLIARQGTLEALQLRCDSLNGLKDELDELLQL